MKKAFIICACILFSLTACFRKATGPISRNRPDSNPSYEVAYLFEHEGCKVYRFLDLGHYIYFTNCQGEISAIQDSLPPTRNMIRKKNN